APLRKGPLAIAKQRELPPTPDIDSLALHRLQIGPPAADECSHIPGIVKLWEPPRQSRGISRYFRCGDGSSPHFPKWLGAGSGDEPSPPRSCIRAACRRP